MPRAATGNRPRRQTRRPPALVNRAVLAILRSRLHRLLDSELCELRYRTGSGRRVTLPVLYATDGGKYVVLIGDSANKRWWRHFLRPAQLELCRGGSRRTGIGRILARSDPDYQTAVRMHQHRHHVPMQPGDQILLVQTGPRSANPPPAG
ncbi:hypothetical protein [Phytohabitans kaempferiae]|uniref:Nitroreductase n=1 Tax=Phytohabitans kaempferiae TaxID=1620943 RepID=A0ABV6MAG5_9ACTN